MAEGSSRVFSSSLTTRRFPALRTLTAHDVEVMVMPAPTPSPRKATRAEGTHLFDPNLVKPSAGVGVSSPPKQTSPGTSAPSSSPRKARPPFRPCNPKEARESITELRHGFVGLHSPYELAHKLQMLERAEAQKLIIGDVFRPNAWSKARRAIEVNYFLNSPDAETIEAERRYIQEKAQRNMVDYYRRSRP